MNALQPAVIADAASAPHGSLARYCGTCRNLTEAERIDRRQPALRLRADGAVQTVHDLLQGEVTAEVDDVVLVRNEGVPAYNFATVVDDAFSGLTRWYAATTCSRPESPRGRGWLIPEA
jgi:glutamyl-tRNA synthetase